MTIYVSEIDNGIILRTAAGDSLGVTKHHFNAEYLQQQKLVTRTAQGRGTVYFFDLDNTPLVLRHYKRGGLVAKLNDDKFIYTGVKKSRCYQELEVLQTLREATVNVPQPIAGLIVKTGLSYTADIITKVIVGACELHQLLQKEAISENIWQDIGVEIRKMHDAQLCHYDINVKNILLVMGNETNKVHLLDFDKCEIKKGNDWKAANLRRLQRSIIKQTSSLAIYYFHANDWTALLAGYENDHSI